MSKGERKFAPLFTVVWIDAWAEGEDGWTWNDTGKMFQFRTNALNLKRAFTSRLRRHLDNMNPLMYGSTRLGRGWYYVTDDWNIMELCRRSDGCPMYACIRETPS